MSLIRRTSPFGELLSLRQAMDRLFEDSFIRPRSWALTALEGDGLPLDVYETEEALVVKAALPGIQPEGIEVTVTGDVLTISATFGEEREAEASGYIYQELRRGAFSRTLTLPGDVHADAAAATFEHGMLTLRIPRTEQAKPRQIRIAGSEGATRAVTVESGKPAGSGPDGR